jgi:hypothetical protein
MEEGESLEEFGSDEENPLDLFDWNNEKKIDRENQGMDNEFLKRCWFC